jgi:hypothetical protein
MAWIVQLVQKQKSFGSFLQKRTSSLMLNATPLLRRYAAWRGVTLAREDPSAAQHRTLMSLLHRARDTAFGQAHRFGSLRSVADYQSAVPLRRYEAFWAEWWQKPFPRLENVTWPGLIRQFALSSGTSAGKTKYIPVSRAMSRANQFAAREVLVHHVANRPASQVLGGTSFILGGSTDLKLLSPGICAGDLSGLAAAEIPIWARARVFPPRELALIADWEVKVAALVEAVRGQDIRSFAGTPSWMLIFLDRLAASLPDRPRTLKALFPNLELLIHGGVGMAPYRDRFAAWLAGSQAETREVYAASEGFVGIADRGPDEGMRALTDNGLFLEFVPVPEMEAAAPTRHWAATVQPGTDYALVLSSNAGLWSYIIGDTVRVVSRRPLRLLITGRIGHALSAFGEHLSAHELDEAIAAAARQCGGEAIEYAAAVIPPDMSEPRGGHRFIVAFKGVATEDAFAHALDAALAAGNDDYAAHRAGDFGMRAPKVHLVPEDRFTRWMQSRGKIGGQNKVPRVLHDEAAVRALIGGISVQ